MIVGAKSQPSLAQASCYCCESFPSPDPVQDSAGFVETFVRTMCEQKIYVVLPVTEITTALVVANREEIERYSRIPFLAEATFNRAANKVAVLALAEKLSIPIPMGVVLTRPGERPQWPEGHLGPVVVKPLDLVLPATALGEQRP